MKSSKIILGVSPLLVASVLFISLHSYCQASPVGNELDVIAANDILENNKMDDNTPPTLVDIIVAPPQIDTSTDDQTITVTLIITDDQNVLWPTFYFAPEDWRWWYPNNELEQYMQDLDKEITSTGYVFRWRMTRPEGIVGGRWVLMQLTMNDGENEVRYRKYSREHEWPSFLNDYFFVDASNVESQWIGSMNLDSLSIIPDQRFPILSDITVDLEASFTTINPLRHAELTFAPINSDEPDATALFTTSTCTNRFSVLDECGWHRERFCYERIEGNSIEGVYNSRTSLPLAETSYDSWILVSIEIEDTRSTPAFYGDCENCDTHPLLGQTFFEVLDSSRNFLPLITNYCDAPTLLTQCLPERVYSCR